MRAPTKTKTKTYGFAALEGGDAAARLEGQLLLRVVSESARFLSVRISNAGPIAAEITRICWAGGLGALAGTASSSGSTFFRHHPRFSMEGSIGVRNGRGVGPGTSIVLDFAKDKGLHVKRALRDGKLRFGLFLEPIGARFVTGSTEAEPPCSAVDRRKKRRNNAA